MNDTTPRYFAKEFAPGRWHVCDRQSWNHPIYDDARDGNDKPLVFDEDSALDCINRMNAEAQEGICPVCGSTDTDRMHHAGTFALPECFYWSCENGHQWGQA